MLFEILFRSWHGRHLQAGSAGTGGQSTIHSDKTKFPLLAWVAAHSQPPTLHELMLDESTFLFFFFVVFIFLFKNNTLHLCRWCICFTATVNKHWLMSSSYISPNVVAQLFRRVKHFKNSSGCNCAYAWEMLVAMALLLEMNNASYS